MERGTMIHAQLSCHMFARKLLRQNGAQLLLYLVVKRNVEKLEPMKMNVEMYLVVAGIHLLKLMASQEIIALNLPVIHPKITLGLFYTSYNMVRHTHMKISIHGLVLFR